MQRMAFPSSDRISLLHDSLLEDILVRLPLQEVVRTSILSKRWISLWTQVPKLVFDELFCKESLRNDKDRVMMIIANIVIRSRKPIIDFVFSLRGLSRLDNPEVYELLSIHQLCSVKRLTLESFCQIEVPPTFRGLPMLTYMDLYGIEIDGGELSHLVSSCPLLETLTLENLQLCCYLDLDASNLRFFCCEGFYFTLSLISAPRLEKMTVLVYDDWYDVEVDSDGPEDLVVPFVVIPAIEYMALDGTFLKYMNAGIQQKISRCQNTLNHLQVIKLSNVPFELIEVSQNVLSLIRRSPNLEKIVVTTCTERRDSDPAIGVWKNEALSGVSLNGLRQARVLNITGKQSELLFIKILLAKSPMLEIMVLSLHVRITEEDGLRLGEEICQFRRASSSVKIVVSDTKTKLERYLS